MQHWFVYYKLDAPTARDLEPRLHGMQQEIAASGVRVQLMRRTDMDGDAITLLEVYGGIAEPVTFESVLSAAAQRAGLPASLLAQRRCERFEEA